MKDFRVSEWMSKDPITIAPSDVLPKAHKMMTEHSIRRLPVMEGEKLVGIVTLGDVREAEPSDATTLSIFELNFMLANLPVSKIMTKDPVHVESSASLSTAASLMLEKKIGGLPVVDDGKLVGIITESDIFRALVEMMAE